MENCDISWAAFLHFRVGRCKKCGKRFIQNRETLEDWEYQPVTVYHHGHSIGFKSLKELEAK